MIAIGILIGLVTALVLAVYCRRKPDSAIAGVADRVIAQLGGGPGPRQR